MSNITYNITEDLENRVLGDDSSNIRVINIHSAGLAGFCFGLHIAPRLNDIPFLHLDLSTLHDPSKPVVLAEIQGSLDSKIEELLLIGLKPLLLMTGGEGFDYRTEDVIFSKVERKLLLPMVREYSEQHWHAFLMSQRPLRFRQHSVRILSESLMALPIIDDERGHICGNIPVLRQKLDERYAEVSEPSEEHEYAILEFLKLTGLNNATITNLFKDNGREFLRELLSSHSFDPEEATILAFKLNPNITYTKILIFIRELLSSGVIHWSMSQEQYIVHPSVLEIFRYKSE